MHKGSIDERIRQALGVAESHLVGSCLRGIHASALMEVRNDSHLPFYTHPMAHEDAYLVVMHLRPMRACETWIDGRSAGAYAVEADAISMFHLARDFSIHVQAPLHLLVLHLPATLLKAAGEPNASSTFEKLRLLPPHAIEDPTIRSLGHCLLPVLRDYAPSRQPFVDHILMGIGSHLVHNYSGEIELPLMPLRGLAPWQEQRAKELMQSHLMDGISLDELAKACRLSPSTFAKAFKQSTGITPYQWFLSRRIELSMTLMSDDDRPLSDVALLAGFADQSHFTRIFTERIGLSPGLWRRGRTRTSA